MEANTGTLLQPSYQDKQKEDKGFTGAKNLAEREVAYEEAMKCIYEYEQTPLGGFKKKTLGVIFKKELLEDWIKHIDTISTYDAMDIRFGIYTQEFINDTPEPDDHNLDKITVFLFPMFEGKPATIGKPKQDQKVNPFNMGEVYP